MRSSVHTVSIASAFLAFMTLLCAGAMAQAPDTSWMRPGLKSMLENHLSVQCLGWSKKGSCALIQMIDGGGRGGYSLRFILLDSVEDEILFRDEAHTEDIGLESLDPDEGAKAWCATMMAGDLSSSCLAHEVDTSSGSAMGRFPLAYKGSKIDVTLATKPSAKALTESEQEDAGRGSKKLDISIVAARSGKGSKVLSKLAGVMASDYSAEGYFLSPFEPRILAVYSISRSGFEGDRSTTLGFAGCNLETGYK